jgi:hypothetical protein
MQSTEFINEIIPLTDVDARSIRIIKHQFDEKDVDKLIDYPVYLVYPEHPIDSDWKRNPYSPV